VVAWQQQVIPLKDIKVDGWSLEQIAATHTNKHKSGVAPKTEAQSLGPEKPELPRKHRLGMLLTGSEKRTLLTIARRYEITGPDVIRRILHRVRGKEGKVKL